VPISLFSNVSRGKIAGGRGGDGARESAGTAKGANAATVAAAIETLFRATPFGNGESEGRIGGAFTARTPCCAGI
jgi:hypothetical protein